MSVPKQSFDEIIASGDSRRYVPVIASTMVNSVTGLSRPHQARGKWSWILLISIFTGSGVTFALFVWDSLVNSCRLQSNTYDPVALDEANLRDNLSSEGYYYCGALYLPMPAGDEWQTCTIGLPPNTQRCPGYAVVYSDFRCYDSTTSSDIILVYYMSCTPLSVALATASTYALYAALVVAYVYFLVRIVKKGLPLWRYASWEAVMFNDDEDKDASHRLLGGDDPAPGDAADSTKAIDSGNNPDSSSDSNAHSSDIVDAASISHAGKSSRLEVAQQTHDESAV